MTQNFIKFKTIERYIEFNNTDIYNIGYFDTDFGITKDRVLGLFAIVTNTNTYPLVVTTFYVANEFGVKMPIVYNQGLAFRITVLYK